MPQIKVSDQVYKQLQQEKDGQGHMTFDSVIRHFLTLRNRGYQPTARARISPEREEIVFGSRLQPETRNEAMMEFGPDNGSEIGVDTLQTLLRKGFALASHRHNLSPTIMQFYEWGREAESAFDVTVSYGGRLFDSGVDIDTVVAEPCGDLQSTPDELGEWTAKHLWSDSAMYEDVSSPSSETLDDRYYAWWD